MALISFSTGNNVIYVRSSYFLQSGEMRHIGRQVLDELESDSEASDHDVEIVFRGIMQMPPVPAPVEGEKPELNTEDF